MTSLPEYFLKDLRDVVDYLIEEHGEDSPCWYSIWSVGDFQSFKKEDYLLCMEDMRNYDDESLESVQARHPEFKPWTDKEMVIIAERMMSNYNPAKEFIAYREASDS